jgi:hypothetical protein
MKLALIDVDGIIADPTKRLSKAEEAAQQAEKQAYDAWYKQNENSGIISLERGAEAERQIKQLRANIYWRTTFTPELVSLDTLIDGAGEALNAIACAGYAMVSLTSRPESMRKATEQWLSAQHFEIDTSHMPYMSGVDGLIMKPASQQYVKTLIWKQGVVELLVRLIEPTELLFIDDREDIQEAIAALDLPCDCKIGGSLQEALAMIGGEQL